MIVSFDFSGTLDKHPELVIVAKKLKAKGSTIYMLSGVNDQDGIDRRLLFIKANDLEFDDLIFTSGDTDMKDGKLGCVQKAEACNRLKIDFHYDNSRKVQEAILKFAPNTSCVLVGRKFVNVKEIIKEIS